MYTANVHGKAPRDNVEQFQEQSVDLSDPKGVYESTGPSQGSWFRDTAPLVRA